MNKNNKTIKSNQRKAIQKSFTQSERRFLASLKKEYYKFANLPLPDSAEDIVNVGYLYPADNPYFIIWLMDKWVAWKDRQLDNLSEGTDAYADVFGTRGFTFDEFKFVLSGKVKEIGFGRHRIFDYLFLTDQADRDFFMVSNTDDDELVLHSYVKAITQSIQLEIPLLSYFYDTVIPIYFSIDSLKRHIYLLAQSGAGKSELLKMLWYDLQRRSQRSRDKTLVLIEPHADMCLEVLQFSLNQNPKYFDRIVYLDPFIRQTAQQIFGYDLLGADYTFRINPFDISPTATDEEINWMTQQLSSAFFDILRSTETTQMEALIEACVETLLRKEGASIADLKRFMDDEENGDLINLGTSIPNVERQKMMHRIQTDRKLHPTQSGIYYRLQSLIGDKEFRRLLVGESTVNLDKEMNSGKVIICNFSKARLGKKAAPAFSKLVMSLIQGIALKRQSISKTDRKESFLFLDEFQNYVSPSIEDIMAESRKYALSAILSHQVYGQKMDTDMRRIVTGNTALKTAGDNGADSVKFMCEQMGNLKPKDFERLPKYGFFIYDKENKKIGAQTIRVPDFLVKQQPPFYMKKEQLKRLFLWLVNDSGYYRKVVPDNKKPKSSTPSSAKLPIKRKPKTSKKSTKKNNKQPPFYDVNFED